MGAVFGFVVVLFLLGLGGWILKGLLWILGGLVKFVFKGILFLIVFFFVIAVIGALF